jgi:hypothetical protein
MESLEEEEDPKGLLLAGEGLRLGDGRDSCELKRGSWNQFSVGRARFPRVRCQDLGPSFVFFQKRNVGLGRELSCYG